MPYNNEISNKIGHKDIINDNDIFKEILSNLELKETQSIGRELESLEKIEDFEIDKLETLEKIFTVDGSLAFDESTDHKVAFIKTGEVMLEKEFKNFDTHTDPRIFAKYIETNKNIYKYFIPLTFRIKYKQSSCIEESLRHIIFDFFEYHSFTLVLKFLFFERWHDKKEEIEIKCLSCHSQKEKFNINIEKKKCSTCGKMIYLTDLANFTHAFFESSENDFIHDKIVPELMLYTETLVLFKRIIFLYLTGLDDSNFSELENTLFLKDGPLNLDKNYTDTAIQLNLFLQFLKSKSINIHLCGQEKTGLIEDYFSRYTEKKMKEKKIKEISSTEILFLNDEFIEKKISKKFTYYKNNTYGSRIVVFNKNHRYILSLNTGGVYNEFPRDKDFVGFKRIINTVLSLKGNTFKNSLYPIHVINQIVTIAKDPSIALLSKFVFDNIKKR